MKTKQQRKEPTDRQLSRTKRWFEAEIEPELSDERWAQLLAHFGVDIGNN